MILLPFTSFNYDPLLRPDPRYTANVFFLPDTKPITRRRQFRIIAGGSGWSPSSLLAGDVVDTQSEPTTGRWLREGHVVIKVAYTVLDSSIVGGGLFDSTKWTRGSGGHLVVDPAALEHRCAELDFCHLIQGIRDEGIDGIPDLDLRPGFGGVWLRSASMVSGAHAMLGPERANPAAGRARFRISTKVGWFTSNGTITSLKAIKNGVAQNHLPVPPGAPMTIGQASDRDVAELSLLRYGALPKAERTPVFMATEGPLIHSGPWDWPSFAQVLVAADLHAPDHVRAYADLGQHHDASQFLFDVDPVLVATAREDFVRRLEAATV